MKGKNTLSRIILAVLVLAMVGLVDVSGEPYVRDGRVDSKTAPILSEDPSYTYNFLHVYSERPDTAPADAAPEDYRPDSGFLARWHTDFGGLALVDRDGVTNPAGSQYPHDYDTMIFWGDDDESLRFSFARWVPDDACEDCDLWEYGRHELRELMRITHDGRIGIGTDSPDVDVNIDLRDVDPLIQFRDNFSSIARRWQVGVVGDAEFVIRDRVHVSGTQYPPQFIPYDRLSIRADTANPTTDAEIHVGDGNGRVSLFIEDGELVVNSQTMTVPDYVFEPSYALLPLEELHAFVESERRLPSVPGGSAIGEEGLNIGEFQMTLLEKIEEQTLYTLQLYDLIQQQEQMISNLAAQVAALEARLERLGQ